MNDSDVDIDSGAGTLKPRSFLGRLLQSMGLAPDSQSAAKASKKAGGDSGWEVVAKTFGLMDAHIMVGRLHAEGIPARAWQEGAGRALGLVVGKLGTAYVEVPPEFVEEAEAILEIDFSQEFEESEEE